MPRSKDEETDVWVEDQKHRSILPFSCVRGLGHCLLRQVQDDVTGLPESHEHPYDNPAARTQQTAPDNQEKGNIERCFGLPPIRQSPHP